MPRILLYVLWAVISTSIVAGVHYYIWARLVRDPGWPQPWYAVATAVTVLLALSIPGAMLLGRVWQLDIAKPLVMGAFVWMGLMFMIVVLLGGVDIAKLLGGGALRVARAGFDLDPDRRLFMTRLIGGGVAATAVVSGAVAVRSAINDAVLERVKVELARLPAAMSGFRIVQISDLHVGPTIGREVVARLVARVNEMKPDLVAITGDLVDGSVRDLAEAVAPLADLRSRYGTFFVTGNHEYYSGVRQWIAHLDSMGIRVLSNERVSIGEGEDAFDLIGVHDHSAHRVDPEHRSDVAKACEGRDTSRELVLLAHQPRAIHAAAEHGVGLQLSGHTHAGQMWPATWLIHLLQPYVRGLNTHNGTTQIYVSRGTGYWGPPMRLGAQPELTEVTLERA